MTQAEFMYELMTAVKNLPDEAQYVIMNDYNEFFDIKKSEGLDEEDITALLPSPKVLAAEYRHGMPTPIDGTKMAERAAPPPHVTALSVFLFILLIPVCAVYEIIAFAVGLAFSVLLLALCIAAAFAGVACFGLSALSRGFILLGVGGLILTVAFVMLSAAAFRGFIAALAFFPKFMSRVLWNRKDKV